MHLPQPDKQIVLLKKQIDKGLKRRKKRRADISPFTVVIWAACCLRWLMWGNKHGKSFWETFADPGDSKENILKLSSKISLAPLLNRDLGSVSSVADRIEEKLGLPHESLPCPTNLLALLEKKNNSLSSNIHCDAACDRNSVWVGSLARNVELVETGC